MISIVDKAKCCGCTACSSVCPKGCVALTTDKEGFLYPVIDYKQCCNCGLCERVCPMLNQAKPNISPLVYAAANKDIKIRSKSSSGGVFTILGEKVLAKNGVVFGARFDSEFNVRHDFTVDDKGLNLFRGSKYLQSEMENNFRRAKDYLDTTGRKVLFSGTPCQIAGLRAFLRKDYDNLITIDFVCHGVPSPMVWKKYLATILLPQGAAAGKNSVFKSLKELPWKGISFRDKRLGWKKYGFHLISEVALKGDKNTVFTSSIDGKELYQPFTENPYMQIFLSNLDLRPSCYDCPSKCGRSGSDITLGDFWGIDKIAPELDDDKGLSLVKINSERGRTLFESIDCMSVEMKYEDALKYNPSIEHSVKIPPYRNLFMEKCRTNGFEKAYNYVMSQTLLSKIYRWFWKFVYSIKD